MFSVQFIVRILLLTLRSLSVFTKLNQNFYLFSVNWQSEFLCFQYKDDVRIFICCASVHLTVRIQSVFFVHFTVRNCPYSVQLTVWVSFLFSIVYCQNFICWVCDWWVCMFFSCMYVFPDAVSDVILWSTSLLAHDIETMSFWCRGDKMTLHWK